MNKKIASTLSMTVLLLAFIGQLLIPVRAYHEFTVVFDPSSNDLSYASAVNPINITMVYTQQYIELSEYVDFIRINIPAEYFMNDTATPKVWLYDKATDAWSDETAFWTISKIPVDPATAATNYILQTVTSSTAPNEAGDKLRISLYVVKPVVEGSYEFGVRSEDTKGDRWPEVGDIQAFHEVKWPVNLGAFPSPLVDEAGKLQATFIYGQSEEHGPCHRAWTIDVAGGTLVASTLGRESLYGLPDALIDVDASTFDESQVTGITASGNLITIGGGDVNLVSRYYEFLEVDGRYVMPVVDIFNEADWAVGIYSRHSGKSYYKQGYYGQGTPVTDYALTALYVDGDRYVLFVAGITGLTTKAMCKILADYEEYDLSGKAVIVQFIDTEGDGSYESVNIMERIIGFGDTVCASIDPAADIDTYIFSANTGDTVLIRMSRTSGSFYPSVRLNAPNGTELAREWNYTTIEFSYTLSDDGGYTILANDYLETETGDYCIYIQKLDTSG